jgi:ubiquinone/menaquinone biosynthesis C-methylase UbiE
MVKDINEMNYIEFMAFLSEANRPPGGKVALKKMLDYCGIKERDIVLDVGCNTGFCSFEASRIKKCRTIGIDLSEDMIKEAKNKLLEDSSIKNLVEFKIADAKNIPFEDNFFDFVFSGGSTAFIDDIPKALKEYKRVAKPWSFIGDINFFYKKSPRPGLINELNSLMGTNIIEWHKEDWKKIYEESGLELFYVIEGNISEVDEKEIDDYVESLIPKESYVIKNKSKERLKSIMTLFNENHKYLSYGIFILRKREVNEDPYLFCP